uniref:hypothetical protein n=1 Tax=Enterococcus faecium TaxID=1352 RepID=UPI0034E989DE
MATATKPNPFKCNYNPNIMRWLGTEYDFADTEIKTYGETRKQLKNGVWGYRDTYRNNIEFMRI